MRKKIIAILKNLVSPKIAINLTVPEKEKFGHYSTNIAFTSGLNAQDIVRKIQNKAPAAFFKKVEAVNGFVNFWLSNKILQDELKEILKKKKSYGKTIFQRARDKSAARRIQVEFVSANPTGPLTLANGRGGFLGDVLSNILEASGYKVEREYYVNDTGNQIITLGKSLIAVSGFSPGFSPEAENLYKGAYIKAWADKHKTLVKKYQNNPLKLGQLAAKDFLKDIKDTLNKSGIRFNRFTSEERHIHKKSFLNKALKIFKTRKLVYEKDGAVWLRTAKFSDDKDRVLITSDGFPTYFLADAGHYLETKLRGFGGKINILGPDHFGYIKRIQAAAGIMRLKNSKVIITQAIRLVENKKEVKMSKRLGRFVTFNDLIKEAGIDAARFFFLMVSPDTHMDFDLALAKERSVKNPVYYVQYAHVRAASILRRAGPKLKIQKSKLNLLNTEDDLSLILRLIRLPEIIEDTAGDYQVHRLTRYATDLARAFHNFYEKERVIGEEKNLAAARLALVYASAIVLKNLLDVLGISSPRKM